MPLARASYLDRLLACPGGAWLAQADTRGPGAIAAANWGTAAHAWKETGLYPGGTTGVALKKRVAASGIDRLKLWPVTGVHEVALAYNVVRGNVMMSTSKDAAYNDRWKAAFDDEWVTGSLDFVDDVFGEPWLDDLKTGRLVHYKDYEAQQSFYVMAWCLADKGKLTRSRSTLTHWPRYPLGGLPSRFGVTMEVEYLELFRDKLAQLRKDILAKDNSLLSTGAQCTYCPSRGACPRLAQLEMETE